MYCFYMPHTWVSMEACSYWHAWFEIKLTAWQHNVLIQPLAVAARIPFRSGFKHTCIPRSQFYIVVFISACAPCFSMENYVDVCARACILCTHMRNKRAHAYEQAYAVLSTKHHLETSVIPWKYALSTKQHIKCSMEVCLKKLAIFHQGLALAVIQWNTLECWSFSWIECEELNIAWTLIKVFMAPILINMLRGLHECLCKRKSDSVLYNSGIISHRRDSGKIVVKKNNNIECFIECLHVSVAACPITYHCQRMCYKLNNPILHLILPLIFPTYWMYIEVWLYISMCMIQGRHPNLMISYTNSINPYPQMTVA